VRIENESGVVIRMIGAFPGCAVVRSAVGQRRLVERVDHAPVGGLEREVMTTGQLSLRGFAVYRRDEQLVRPEIAFAGAADRHAERLEDGGVEALRGGEIPHDQLNVIDQASPVQLLRFHSVTSFWPSIDVWRG